MKILTKWLKSYLPDLPVDAKLAEDLTLRGIAVEGIYDLGNGNGSLYEMDITTNRVDAMNHYGIAREAAAIYNLQLQPLDFPLPAPRSAPGTAVSTSVTAVTPWGAMSGTTSILRTLPDGSDQGDSTAQRWLPTGPGRWRRGRGGRHDIASPFEALDVSGSMPPAASCAA